MNCPSVARIGRFLKASQHHAAVASQGLQRSATDFNLTGQKLVDMRLIQSGLERKNHHVRAVGRLGLSPRMGHKLGFDLGIGDHHKFPWLQAKAGWSQDEGCF